MTDDFRPANAPKTSQRPTTTERGLGWSHRKVRAALLRRHVDGTPCDECRRPMYRDAAANWDRRVLAADHTLARALGGTKADRLLHSTCNERRGDGTRTTTSTGWPPETTREW